jgi:hypothetical protein
MTEPMIEETEAEVEEFTDELSDEALDREQGEGKFRYLCVPIGTRGRGQILCRLVPVADR